jgi:steroid delta-isomerase-like uncharacterized protein
MNTSAHSKAMSTRATTPRDLVQAVLEALSEGRIAEAVEQFDDHFTFNDRALGLRFSDREQLRTFFRKSRELFPDTAVELVSINESGDAAFAEWSLTASRLGYYCAVPIRMPITLPGASIARTRNGRISDWCDYYDEKSSMRLNLASRFLHLD